MTFPAPSIAETALPFGWCVDSEYAARVAGEAWLKVALPKLLRIDVGPWFATPLGSCNMLLPCEDGAFSATAAAVCWHPVLFADGKEDFSRVTAEKVVCYSPVLLRPVHTPHGQNLSIILVCTENNVGIGQVVQASAHDEMFDASDFGPVGAGVRQVPTGMGARVWAFGKRNLFRRELLVGQETLRYDGLIPWITTAGSMRMGCVDAPENAERADAWVPLAANWRLDGNHLEDDDLPSVEAVVADLRRFQDVSTADVKKLVKERHEVNLRLPHPLAPFENEPDVLPHSEVGKRLAKQAKH